MTIVWILVAWSIIGGTFFEVWRRVNALDLYTRSMSEWKILVALIVGGPLVWLLTALS